MKIEKAQSPVCPMAIVLLNAMSNWAAYHALRAVAAYLAEHPKA